MGPVDFSQYYAEDESALRDLLNLPYWSRAWVLQELVAARKICLIWNNLIVLWDTFWASLNEMQFSREHNYTPHDFLSSNLEDRLIADAPGDWIEPYTAYKYFRFRKNGLSTLSLAAVVNNLYNSKCCDPRDRIYSIRSLLTNGRSFQVNYDEPPIELAIRAAEHFSCNPPVLEAILIELEVNETEWAKLPHKSGDGSTDWMSAISQHHPDVPPGSWISDNSESSPIVACLENCPHCGSCEGTIWNALPRSKFVLCISSDGSTASATHIFSLLLKHGPSRIRFGPVSDKDDKETSQWVTWSLNSNFSNWRF